LEGSPPFLIQLDSFTQQPVVQFPFVFPQVGLGSHVVAITDMIGCTLEIDIEVESAEFGVLDIGPDVLIQKGDSTLIEPSYDDINVMRVTWNPSMPGQGLEPFWLCPELTTLISVIVEDTAGCIYEDSLLITVVEEETFFIPNVFTPNGDQINDVVFLVTNLPDDRLISFEIFDRWGNMLFGQYVNGPFQWDGKSKEEDVQSGVYVYKLLWKDLAGNTVAKVGDITLLK
jgi:gliding motility-associated-like protein